MGRKRNWAEKGQSGKKEVSMKYVLRRVAVLMLFFLMGSVRSNDWPQETNEPLYSDEESGGRTYHGATHDIMTGTEHSPFMFTTSSLGLSLRATSFLLGHLYEASDDPVVREQLMEEMESCCEKILNLYVICHEALRSVERQLHNAPEKSGYLLEEVEQLHQRIVVLSECFSSIVGSAESHEISTIFVTLNMLIKKTGQMRVL